MNKKMYNNTKTVYWKCDKVSCQKENYRIIQKDSIIFEDKCDACSHTISEPITIDIEGNNRKNDKPKTSR